MSTIKSVYTVSILVVEDNDELQAYIRNGLQELGFEVSVDTALDGQEGLDSARSRQYDLVLLDVDLPTMNGFEVCKKLREEGIYTPLLFLTGKQADEDRLQGLGVGADDYLVKPFSMPELLARCRALLRRSQRDPLSRQDSEEHGIISFAKVRIDLDARRVWADEQELDLTATEFELLTTLVKSAGRVFSRGELLQSACGYQSESYSHILYTHISRLRKVLGSAPSGCVVSTIRGRGYCLEEIENGG